MSVTTTASEHRVSNVARELAKDRLGTFMVTGHALSGSAPLTVVAAGTTTGFAITATQGLPLAYAVVAAALMLFSVGFVAMARHNINAGAFYSYITRGLGKPAGTGAAFLALLAYNAMQTGLYGGFGVLAAGFMTERAGVDWPWWAWALIGWTVVTLFGLLRIDLNGMILGALLVTEITVIFIYDVVIAGNPGPEGYSMAAFSLSHLGAAGFGAAAVTAVAGFVGFEATTVFSEETKDPKRTVARATYLSLILVGSLYAISAWLMTVAAGPSKIVEVAGVQQTELLFWLVSPNIGTFFVDAGRVLVVTSLFAALLAFHNTCARYKFALGREQVLPASLGRTGTRTGAPVAGSAWQSAIGLTVILTFAVAGWDPIVHLFFWLTVYGALGVLALMTLTSAAVFVFFTFRNRPGEGIWRSTIAPVLAFTALSWILLLTVSSYHNLLGVPAGHLAAWLFPTAMVAVFAAGMLWAGWLRQFNPAVYACIGLGANTSTIRARDGRRA